MAPPPWLEVLDETARVCAVHGRSDLVELVQQKRIQLLDPQLRVLVVGEPKQGKSQLINALLNAPVCPVGDGLTTVLPTVIKHSEAPYAAMVRASLPAHALTGGQEPDAADRTPLPLDQVPAGVGGKLRHAWGSEPVHVEIGVPRGLLASGLVVIDTPGVDGQDLTPIRRLSADVVLVASDATRELSVTELNLLLQLAQSHARVIVALTKTDMSPHWRVVAEQDRLHLASVGVPAALIPVSAALRLQAARTNDQMINAESGFPALISRLMHDQSCKSDELARASVSLVTRTVIEQLAAALRAETSIDDSAPGSGTMSKLHDAQRAVEDLRRCTVKWQNTLNDEMAGLISDLEYDLRDRTRKILTNVDEMFDKADPLNHWDTFADWLEDNLIEAAEANYGWMVQRCDSITRRVADHFLPYGYGYEALPTWSVKVPDDLAERVPIIEKPFIEKFTPTQKLFTGLRGSYGGLLMVGLATSLMDMHLINPYSVGAGVVFGGKTIYDESKSLLRRRQSTAKTASQRHVDEFFLRFSKDCRDTVRHMQRMLRDHFSALTEELQEALVHSFRRAKQAADADATERDQHMKQLAALYEDARALVAGPATRARAGLGTGA
ncbi:MAG TPA: GTP-binding protein [Micromonosporaceae bacterium]|nr:GTP-binding protein [Micromonosporaceae bacterium]